AVHTLVYETLFAYPGRLLIWRMQDFGVYLVSDVLYTLLRSTLRLSFAWAGRRRAVHRAATITAAPAHTPAESPPKDGERPSGAFGASNCSSRDLEHGAVTDGGGGAVHRAADQGDARAVANERESMVSSSLMLLPLPADVDMHAEQEPGKGSELSGSGGVGSGGVRAVVAKHTAADGRVPLHHHHHHNHSHHKSAQAGQQLAQAIQALSPTGGPSPALAAAELSAGTEQTLLIFTDTVSDWVSRVGSATVLLLFVSAAPWSSCRGRVAALALATRIATSAAVYAAVEVPTIAALHGILGVRGGRSGIDAAATAALLVRVWRPAEIAMLMAGTAASVAAAVVAAEAGIFEQTTSECFVGGRMPRGSDA
ncbi:hypothetical protein HK405_006973, partial [Cladochytrium tenue]